MFCSYQAAICAMAELYALVDECIDCCTDGINQRLVVILAKASSVHVCVGHGCKFGEAVHEPEGPIHRPSPVTFGWTTSCGAFVTSHGGENHFGEPRDVLPTTSSTPGFSMCRLIEARVASASLRSLNIRSSGGYGALVAALATLGWNHPDSRWHIHQMKVQQIPNRAHK